MGRQESFGSVSSTTTTTATVKPTFHTETSVPEQKHQDTDIQYPTGAKFATILGCLTLGTFLVAIDIVIISVANPKISTTFQAPVDVGWYGSAYLLTVTALQPAAGNLFKLFSARFIYLSSIITFEGVYD